MTKNNNFKILLVDDRKENLSSLEELLDAPNRVFLKANSGNEALKLSLNHDDIGLIMLDVQMPGMDGFEVAGILQSNAKTKDISIIFVTAISKEEQYALKGFAHGAVDYLHKPLDVNITRAKVNVFEQLYNARMKLSASMKEIAAINARLTRFSHVVAHDIKSPLSGMVTILSLLCEEPCITSDPRVTQYTKLLYGASMQLSNMVDSILQYSKESHTTQRTEEVDTKKLVQDIVTLLFPPDNIMVNIVGTMPVLQTNRAKLHQVFQNLLSNAIKYMDKESGLIEVSADEKDSFIEFSVHDNGPGLDDAARENLFKPFAAGSSASSRESSTGIGLNLLQMLVQEQGGELRVNSVKGHGTTVFFTWRKVSQA